MSTAIYAFSGDPITFGHIDIVERAAKAFDKVIVAIGHNTKKKYTFDLFLRKQLAETALKHFKNVEVVSFEGLLVDFAYEIGVDIIIRGIRNFKDFDYENEMFHINMSQNKNIDTFFIIASQDKSHISSSAVKELQKEQGLIHKYVPLCVKHQLEAINGQFIVGLTGGIASGKSYFGELLSKNSNILHNTVHNIELDEIGHELLSSSDQLSLNTQQQVLKTFFTELTAYKATAMPINRKALGEIVFDDQSKQMLKMLNQIMYEPMLIKLRRKLRNLKGLILINGALIAEFDMSHLCNNNVIVVKTTDELRIERLTARGLSDDQINRRLNCQLNDDEKIHLLRSKIEQDNFGQLCIVNNDNRDLNSNKQCLCDFFKLIGFEL